MDDAHDAEPEQSPYIRLPWALVAAALAGVLLLALGFGMFANRYLRPQLGAAPTPIPLVAAAEPTATEPPATPAPTVAPTPIATSLEAATRLVVATPTQPPATVPPAASPTPLIAAPTSMATPRPTVSPELAAEVGDAYQQYWQVRAEALYSLDTSRLPEVMAGDHLADAENLINKLRGEGYAIETKIEHHYAVFEASVDSAKVADSYADRSIYVDMQTHAQVTAATGDELNEVYIMNKSDGIWRVITLVRSP